MRRIAHRVFCSGTYHEVWRDTEGRLHRTCNGEGCTRGFESARALLRGRPDKPHSFKDFRGRYSARWGEDWDDAKRRAWQIRAARRRARGEPVAHPEAAPPIEADWALDAIDPMFAMVVTAAREDMKVATILRHLKKRCEHDLAAATYKGPTAKFVRPAVTSQVQLTDSDTTVPPTVWITRHVHTEIKEGKHYSTRYTQRTAVMKPHTALAARIALGGTQLVRSGAQRLFAVAVLEQVGWGPGGMAALLCRQGRGLAASSAPALVRRTGPHAEFVRWLEWSQLSPATIALYGEFLRAGAKCANMEIIDTAIEATRGSAEYAEARYAQMLPLELSCRSRLRDIQQMSRALAQVPAREQLREEYVKRVAQAKEYASAWGELLGCPQSCHLSDNDLDISKRPLSFARCDSIQVAFPPQLDRYHACSIIEPAVALERHYSDRAQVEQTLKADQRAQADDIRKLKRYGYRLNTAGNLEELA